MWTRREFLKDVAAAGTVALAGGCEVDEIARLVDDVRTVARIGVLANTEVTWLPSAKTLEKALAFYRQERADAVVITGKTTKDGYRNQEEVLRQVWNKVFVGSDARLILEDGRHEVKGFPFMVSRSGPYAKADVVTFHGGGKHALTDEFRFYNRSCHALYAGSMSGVRLQDGYECGDYVGSDRLIPCCQGLLVGVYAAKMVVRRLDFSPSQPVEKEAPPVRGIYAEDVADPSEFGWDGSAPEQADAAPAFWPDTVVRTLPGSHRGVQVLTVTWPNLLKRFVGVRAHSYEVGLHLVPGADGNLPPPIAVKNVMSPEFLSAETRDGGPVSCAFEMADLMTRGLKGRTLVASVTPVGYFGARGKPAVSSPMAM